MESFVKLDAWQVALELVKEIYYLTQKFPNDERFGMTSQLRRAATSITANIAEGFSRITPADKLHKFIIARGECSEVHAFLICAVTVGFVDNQTIDTAVQLALRTGKLITGMVNAQRRAISRTHDPTISP